MKKFILLIMIFSLYSFANSFLDKAMDNIDDDLKYKKYITKACESGNEEGCLRLSIFYIEDESKRVEIYKDECDKKNYSACNFLGTAYNVGRGVDRNILKAKEFYEISCEGDNGSGCYSLGSLYGSSSNRIFNINKSLFYYEKSCNLGTGIACTEIANFFEEVGPLQDINKTKNFYSRGCKIGYDHACYTLGRYYINGILIKKDTNKGLELFKKSCEKLNHNLSCQELGKLYSKNKQFLNKNTALFYFKKGCELEDKWSCRYYKELIEE